MLSFALAVMMPIWTCTQLPNVQPGPKVDRQGDPLPAGALARSIGADRHDAIAAWELAAIAGLFCRWQTTCLVVLLARRRCLGRRHR